MLRIFILADDLSGAADSGVACAAAGLKTTVALDSAAGDCNCDALSLDADTRCMDPAAAASEVARAIKHYAADRDLLIFKKIDSTLRGNVAQELAAALNAFRSVRGERAIAIMAPAFPAIGRTTADGIQLLFGRPLHEVDLWRIHGLSGHAFIPEMLKCAGLQSVLLRLVDVRRGAKPLAERMKALAPGTDVVICDAETDADLHAIACASMELETRPIWVGSAGLAYPLPHAAGCAAAKEVEMIAEARCSGPLLFVIGSLSRNSIEQVRALNTSGLAISIQVRPDILMGENESESRREYLHQLKAALRMGRDVLISMEPEPQMDFTRRPQLAAALGRMTAAVSSEVGALIASGGETARAVLHGWGVSRLRLLGELESGIPISVTEGWSRELPVITKAGDFGRPDTLLKCLHFLHGRNGRSSSQRDLRKVTQ